MPRATHNACFSNTAHGLTPSSTATSDDADSTITSPITVSRPTRPSSRTNDSWAPMARRDGTAAGRDAAGAPGRGEPAAVGRETAGRAAGDGRPRANRRAGAYAPDGAY